MFAQQINAALVRENVPSWALRAPGYMGASAQGNLSDYTEQFDMSKLRGFDLWLGNSFESDRRATISVDKWGIRADVWGESAAWAKETSARVKHYLDEMRPWWWWLRAPWGAAILYVVVEVLLQLMVGALEIANGVERAAGTTWALVGSGMGIASLLAVFVVPKLRVGVRSPSSTVLFPFFLWLLGSALTTAVGIFAAAALGT